LVGWFCGVLWFDNVLSAVSRVLERFSEVDILFGSLVCRGFSCYDVDLAVRLGCGGLNVVGRLLFLILRGLSIL